MLRKLIKRLTNNFGLKVLAVVFAVILWLFVVNVEDPDKATLMTIPVTIENETYLTEMGKTYEVLRNAEISFTVSGSRSIIEELSESDFTAVANMENINEEMTMVPISITPNRYANQIEISRRSGVDYLYIHVEDLVTEKFTIEPKLEGTPAEYCYVDDTDVNPKRVTVTGPKSVVDTIESAQVTVSVDGAEENVVTNGDIVLLDANGSEVPQDRLSLNRTKAAVDVVILMGKTVPIHVSTTGTPADGYVLGEVSASLNEVHLTGSPEALDQIKSLDLAPPQLDVTGRTENYTVTLALSGYLPEDVSLTEGEPETLTVTVEILGQETRMFRVPVKNIVIENLDQGLLLEFDEETIDVPLKGFAKDLDEVDAESLTGTLDASKLTKDSRSGTVVIDGKYNVASEIHVSVTIKEADKDKAAGAEGEGGT